MKYLLVLAVVFIAVFLWRKNRRDALRAKPPKPAAAKAVGAPTNMVRCAHCGLHLPAGDAITGPDGVAFCGAAHREAAGRSGTTRR